MSENNETKQKVVIGVVGVLVLLVLVTSVLVGIKMLNSNDGNDAEDRIAVAIEERQAAEAELAEARKLLTEQAEADKLAEQQAEADKLAAEQAETERLAELERVKLDAMATAKAAAEALFAQKLAELEARNQPVAGNSSTGVTPSALSADQTANALGFGKVGSGYQEEFRKSKEAPSGQVRILSLTESNHPDLGVIYLPNYEDVKRAISTDQAPGGNIDFQIFKFEGQADQFASSVGYRLRAVVLNQQAPSGKNYIAFVAE